MPRYLLAPDVALQLDADRDQCKRLLIEAFWNTGGRLNEVLPLTLKDFALDGQDGRALDAPFVVLHTLKQRRDGDRQKQRGRCRPTKEEQAALREAEAIPPRAVPLTDPGYGGGTLSGTKTHVKPFLGPMERMLALRTAR